MASIASGSQLPPLAGASTSTLEERPQAEPLPAKAPLVGEIGYQAISERPQDLQDVDLGDGPNVDASEGLNAAEADARNGRHPADRSNVNLASQSSTSLPAPDSNVGPQRSANDSTTSIHSKRSIFSFHSFKTKTYKGVTLRTLTRTVAIVLILCGLTCAWTFAGLRLKASSAPPPPTNLESVGTTTGTSTIFIHVAFAVIVLILFILLERSIFQLRAERYAHFHPGQILPSHRHGMGASTGAAGMALAPWNRPPLPTYAAALGVRGTGDVEDNIIAVPPPPQYGNTRGSTLLLSSFLRRSGMSSRSHASAQSGRDWQLVERHGSNNRMSEISARSMPISYTEVEHQNDVERARILEETLARLEDGQGNVRPSAEART